MVFVAPSLGHQLPAQAVMQTSNERSQTPPISPLFVNASVVSVVCLTSTRRQQQSRGYRSVRRVISLRGGDSSGGGTKQIEADLSRCYVDKLGPLEKQKLQTMREQAALVVGKVKEAYPSWHPDIWGVEFQHSSEALDIVLLKFLRAERLDIGKAVERLSETLTFRAKENLGGLATAELPDHFKGHDTIVGPDVEGRPIMISRYGKMDNDRVFGNLEEFVRYRLQIMEQAMAKVTFQRGMAEDLCQVHDYSGVSLLFKTAEVKAGVAAMTKVFGEHYPETKGKTVFVNFPTVFSKLFQAFSFFIPERTRRKFVILGEADQDLLFEQIRPELVPEALGGLLRASQEASFSVPADRKSVV